MIAPIGRHVHFHSLLLFKFNAILIALRLDIPVPVRKIVIVKFSGRNFIVSNSTFSSIHFASKQHIEGDQSEQIT